MDNPSDEHSVLQEVELIDPHGVNLLDAVVAFRGNHSTQSSWPTFPPERSAEFLPRYSPLRRFVAGPRTESLMVLLGIKTSHAGEAGYRSIRVRYRVGEHEHDVVIPWSWAACTPAEPDCGKLPREWD
jgi:hypothetical protein